MKILATLAYIAFIAIVNYLIVRLPEITVFGAAWSPVDLLVGLIYLLRDFAQREIRHFVLIAMIVGSVLSYFMATPAIALASVTAFTVGEFIDWLIFTWTKQPLSQRLIWSAFASSPFDTLVFLYMIGRLNWVSMIVMTMAKLLGAFLFWLAYRARRLSSSRCLTTGFL